MPRKSIEDIKPSCLLYRKPCKKGHYGPNGACIYYKDGRGCIACHYSLPSGLVEIQFPDMDQTMPKVPKTAEQMRFDANESSKRYHSRNREAYIKYQREYYILRKNSNGSTTN